eukprot:PhM_4_TR15898/c2_g3_i3/m.71908
MGFAPMAELMDVAVKILATTGLPPGVRVATHIDNVRFLHADRALVAKAAENFRCNCDRVSVTLNAEPGNEPHQQGTFCGVVYDYAAGNVKLTDQFVRKVKDAAAAYYQASTLRNAEILFGCIFHAAAVLRAPLAEAYYVIKWYRKKMSEAQKFSLGPDARAELWMSARGQLDRIVDFIAKNAPTSRVTGPTTADLFTDASDWGWGAVVVHEGTVRQVGERWTPLEAARSINEREVMAVTNALAYFPDVSRNGFRLHIDNTAAMWSIASGRSRGFFLNERVKELEEQVRKHAANFTVRYIASAANPADEPSRGAQLSSLPGGVNGAKNKNKNVIKILAHFNPNCKINNQRSHAAVVRSACT